jgi:hypothetical protein
MAADGADRSRLHAFHPVENDGKAPGLPLASPTTAAAAPACARTPSLAQAQTGIAAPAAAPPPFPQPVSAAVSSESKRAFALLSSHDAPALQHKVPRLGAAGPACGGATTDSECEAFEGDCAAAASGGGSGGGGVAVELGVVSPRDAGSGGGASKRPSRAVSIDDLEASHSRILTRCPSCRLRLKAKKFSAQEFILMCPAQTCIFPLDRPDLRTYEDPPPSFPSPSFEMKFARVAFL